MSSVITIANLPSITTLDLLKKILIGNQIRWIELDLHDSSGGFKEGYVLLKNDQDTGTVLRLLNECEVSDLVLKADLAPEDIQNSFGWKNRSFERPAPAKASLVDLPDEIFADEADEAAEESENVVVEEEPIAFDTLGLSPIVLENLRAVGFINATPIQALAIAPAMEGCDLIGRAQTGTGKTLAFCIPVVERLLAKPGKGIRALVLAPTRELAVQIKESIDKILVNIPLRAVVVYGGENIVEQMMELGKGCDILIATPGRLLDIQSRGRLRFDAAEILILDEADRMLDMGFMPQVRAIFKCFYEHPQTLLFSATIPQEIKKLTGVSLKNPVLVDVGMPDLTPLDTVTQEVFYVSPDEKIDLLYRILDHEEGSVMIFTRTKIAAERLAKRLKSKNYAVTRIHGDIEQADRTKAVELFKQGRYKILVGTDVVARGIDIKGIAHVINYDLPMAPEDHLHRIGRTARAGATGRATTFVTHAERRALREFRTVLGQGKK